jgi:hypothetical protein
MKLIFAATLLSLAALPYVSAAQSDDPSVDSYIESMRADARADKIAIITAAMQFNDQDSKAFWPVYRKYEADLVKVNDKRVALVKGYVDKFDTLTDADAKAMIDQSLEIESNRADLRKKYAKEFLKANISPLTVAKYLQLEHRLDLIVDLQLAAHLPPLLIKPAGQTADNK